MFCKLQVQYRMKKCIFATDFLHFVIDFLIRIQIATHSVERWAAGQRLCGLRAHCVFLSSPLGPAVLTN